MEKKIEALQEQMMTRSVPCNVELQELMHQIDIMVNNKKREWEKKLQALEARMTVRDQELASAQSRLDQKGLEVGLLRQKLDSLQKTKYEMAENYDTQLQALKNQFAKLTQSYEKLQLHQLKQKKAHSLEKCTENQEPPFQLSSLNQKLEEFRAKSREWDKQETLYQNHLVSLDAQRKLLSEKCNLFQKQAQHCQIQTRRQELSQDDVGTCSQCQTEHPGVRRDVLAEPAERNELFMEKLKSTVSEIVVGRNRLQEENLKLQQEVKMYQRKCQNIEARLAQVTNELKSREDLLSMVELECQQLRNEVTTMEEYKNNKENRVKLQSAYAQCIKDLEIKKAQILALEQQQENQQKELNQIRDRLYQEEQSHRSEVERMRTEISDLTEELHQKEITIATIMEKAALLERQLQTELEIKEKMLGKQQMIDLSKKEHTAYSDSIDKLEHERGVSRNDLAKLSKGKEMPLRVNPIMYLGRNCAKQTAVKVEEKEERPAQNESEWAPQPAAYEKFGHYRTQIPAWHGQGDIVSRTREPTADGRSPSPQEAYSAHYSSCLPEKNKSETLLSQIYVSDEIRMASPETLFPATVTEKFLQEEEKRARDFEQVLNSHIEELQRQSENTIKKYTAFKQSRHR
ncbi:deuterosome assembly protein 1 [Zootoca vivipara]|uniref:deuterosome assembly protein 1 n=1 Tax=Zootoca vivipara TaxID=8524 RepID=UPI00293B9DFC|nr:deuterosome assembly protein 1 [Zootoca vivipara]